MVAVAAKFGLVLVGGHKCLNIIKTEDVEQQDKICTNQEREKKNTAFDKKVSAHQIHALRVLTEICVAGCVSSARTRGTCRCEL